MTHYEQRKIKFLQDPEVAEGYREMAIELQSVQFRASLVQQEDDQNNQASSSSGPLTPESPNLKGYFSSTQIIKGGVPKS